MERYRDRLREMLPHYIAIVVLILLTLWIADLLIDDLSGVARLALAAIVALLYPVVIRQLGLAPDAWT